VKKDETRFTIRFNPIDPRHQAAMDTLEASGRRKASLIADALCEYLARHGGGTAFPYMPPPPLAAEPLHSISNEVADAADTTTHGASDAASFDDDMRDAVLGGLSAFKV